MDKIYKDKLLETNIKRADMTKLLRMATASHFIFKNKVIEQIDGVAMGSALSVAMANIFMVHLEESLVKYSPNLSFYRRYVDDIFLVISFDYLNELFSTFNEFHSSVKFTFETEDSGCFSFLDVKILRSVGSLGYDFLETSVYRKATFTGLFVNWKSYCHMKYKLSIIRGLHERARRICSTDSLFLNEIMFINNILKKNGFPEKILKKNSYLY